MSSVAVLRYRGIVQGVGFRPAVWRVANELGLTGDVSNDGDGVLVRLWADDRNVSRFRARFETALPPLSHVEAVVESREDLPVPQDNFQILPSNCSQPLTGIAPDAAICDDCAGEISDPENRRFGYAFTNCTNCGPRLSIVTAIPYDRVNTSMAAFQQCPACAAEYTDPANRRYHAQPNACPVCGPRIWLQQEPGAKDPISHCQTLLNDGAILAIKGIGGFHLCCDATNADAVNALRRRKRRYSKPFALMARDLDVIRRYCRLGPAEQQLLESSAAPIVLLDCLGSGQLAGAVAPESDVLGFMLPYSPLHKLLLATFDQPLVMTSGNLSDEPQCTQNKTARTRLQDIADEFLLHDRDIVNRIDDSVVQIAAGAPRLLRRARGYAPAPIRLHQSFDELPPVLALGAELKNTICLLQHGQAIVSQHLGDLEDARTADDFERTVGLYRSLYAFDPTAVAVDCHPDYRSTRYGRQLARQLDCPLHQTRHHHAHIAAVLAENDWPLDGPPVLGIAFDGLGLGDDDTLWGGEFLLADYLGYRRVGCLAPTPMPGGTRSIVEPWRNAWAQLNQHVGWGHTVDRWGTLDCIRHLAGKPFDVLEQMVARRINSPLTSSVGRLFDAVAAVLGLQPNSIDYEGQAAIALQQLAEQSSDPGAYPFSIEQENSPATMSPQPMWPALLEDLEHGVAREQIARRFHNGLVQASVELTIRIAGSTDIDTVALSGGVFQNRLMLAQMNGALSRHFRVLHHTRVPSNDGGLALGQASITAAQLTRNSSTSA